MSTPETIINSPEFFLDTCNGFLQEVPENFDNGRTQIQFSAISVSKNFVAIGSECGALFLYNRNLNRTVKPLRTNDCESVTSLELYANDEVNYLAVGRSSGTVIIMCLPSAEKNRKLRQSIQDEIHRGQAITRVRWSPDGNRLYTADISGQVIAIDVDFDNELYSCIYVSDKSNPIRDLNCSNDYLIYCTFNEWDLVEAKNIKIINNGKIEEQQDIQIIASIILDDSGEEPAIVLSNGQIKFINSDKTYFNYFDENVLTKKLPDGKGYYDAILRNFENETSTFDVDDFKIAHFYQKVSNIGFFWSSDKLLIIEFPTLISKCFNFIKLTENDLFEIVAITIDSNTNEIFILTRDQKVLRLAIDKAALELLVANEPKPSASTATNATYSIVNSFMSAAQNSSSLFSRFSSIKELEKIKEELRTNPRISDLQNRFNEAMTHVAAQSAESGSRLANELIDQFKNSSLAGDFDSTAKSWKISEQQKDERSESPEMQDPNPNPIIIPFEPMSPEKELIVTRKKKTKINPKRDDLYGISPSELVQMKNTEEYLQEAENKLNVSGESVDAATSDVEDHTLEAIIRGDYSVKPQTSVEAINLANNDLNGTQAIISAEIHPENGVFEMAVIDEEDEEKSFYENENNQTFFAEVPDSENLEYNISDLEPRKIEKDSPINFDDDRKTPEDDSLSEESENESLEAAAARSLKLAEKEIEKEQEAAEYDKVEDISTAIIQLPIELQTPDYSQISNLANHRTDIWNTFSLPFTISDFDVSSSYIVIIPRKHLLYYPHYRILDVIQNGLRGGGWTPLKMGASQIAVNDQGNLLWKIHKSKAYAPDVIDESSPVCDKWHTQADHAKIIQISLTSKHAWYLTENDICVQMFLPDMGILHQTDCVFRVHSLTASDHAVWALRSDKNTLITRTGIDPQICPMGVDWVEDSLGGPTSFVSVALYDKTGFGIDLNGFLWFVNGVDEKNPLGCGCWFQTCYPSILNSSPQIKKQSIKNWQLKVSSLGIFFSVGKHLIAAMQPLTGHVIKHVISERLSLHDNFSIISASGNNNAIFVCQPNSEVYHFDPKTKNLSSIPNIDTNDFSIIALTTASRRLYLLDSSGNIYIRRGLNSEHTPLGQTWEKIDTYQINSKICSIATSTNSLWIVSEDGSIFIATEGLKIGNSPHWEKIIEPKMSGGGVAADKINQIRCSPSGKYVWIFSFFTGRGFARSGIDEATSNQWKGNSWIETPSDIKLRDLAVGENVIWGIEQNSTKTYRLRNLSSSNIVGIGWRLMPFNLKTISIDATNENRLWGLDENGRLVKHEMDIYPRKSLPQQQQNLNNKPPNLSTTVNIKNCRPSTSDSTSSADSWADIGSNGYSLCKEKDK